MPNAAAYPEWNIFPSSVSRVFHYLIKYLHSLGETTRRHINRNTTPLNLKHTNTSNISISSSNSSIIILRKTYNVCLLKTWHFIYPNNFVKLWGFQSIIVKWFDKDDASGILDICEISRLNCYILFKVKESLRSFWAGANFLSFNASSFPIVLPLLNKGCHTAMMLIPY